MASIIRTSLVRSAGPFNGNVFGTITILRPLSTPSTMTTKALKCKLAGDKPKKPDPWPYNSKRYNFFHFLYDRTTKRFDENSKLIVVEGPVAAGKTKLAKKIAEEFDLQYFPEANLDMIYFNSAGFDLRTLDDQLPDPYKSFDVNNFLLTPNHRLTARFQIDQYCVKYNQYIDALAHIFSTGQGVVLDRCVYSDFVFLEAMYSHCYVSKGARNAYYSVRNNSIRELLRPHLVLYLDMPVECILKNIKTRGNCAEKNSPAMCTSYLKAMEKNYKQGYLKEISKHAELLIYDWSEGGDEEVVIEDIERINFNKYDVQDTQMKDWDIGLEEEYAVYRNLYSDNKHTLLSLLEVPYFDVPELVATGDEAKQYYDVMENTPGERYLHGYDQALGDKGLLFKMHHPHRFPLPLRERRPTFT